MENADIARIFQEISDILEIRGDNPFRVRSYRNAAETLGSLAENLAQMVTVGQDLQSIPGIGAGISKKIIEIVNTGDCDEHRRLLTEIPHSLLDLLRIPGLGPKKVGLLYSKLSVSTLQQLEDAARNEKLRDLPGMGAKTEDKILRGLERLKETVGRNLMSTVWAEAASLDAYLRTCPAVTRLEFAGSFRRRRETIGDLDVLVTGSDSRQITETFVTYPPVVQILAHGDTKSSVRLRSGLQVDLRVLEPQSFGAALQYFTGSQAHNIALRDRAKRRGLKVNEYGVYSIDGAEMIAGSSEEGVYRALGLNMIPPELRENRGEIEAAEIGGWTNLVEERDLRGDLHVHTTESDGRCSIEQLAAAAQVLGYEYIAITDHSKSVYVANGLDEDRLRQQIEFVNRFNDTSSVPFRVLTGCEVDIRADGSLDLDEEVLGRLDVVIVAVHSHMQMSREDMTRRIITALSHPCVNILAHPTGRVLLRRESYSVDMDQVLDAARTYNVAMEINAFPGRLDLNDAHCRLAKSRGVKLVINTDTHKLDQMNNMRYGVFTARRGWLDKEDILNTFPLEDLRRILRHKGRPVI